MKNPELEQKRVDEAPLGAEVKGTPDVTETAPEAKTPEVAPPSITEIMNGAPGTTTMVGGAEEAGEGQEAQEGQEGQEVEVVVGGGQQNNENEQQIQGTIKENQQADQNQTPEQQQQAQEEQAKADQNEILEGPTDDEFEAYINSILGEL